MSQPVNFHYTVQPFYFPNRSYVKDFIVNLIKREGKKIEAISYVFCSDDYLLKINKQYLNHNTLTDIITFQLSPKDEPVLADVFISVERVKENAATYNTTFQHELLRVIFHGALHLCGFGDKSKTDVVLMREKENFYLKRYFVSRGTTL